MKDFADKIVICNNSDKKIIYIGSFLILISSAILISFAGMYVLFIIPIILAAVLSIRYRVFPLQLYLFTAPFLVATSASLINYLSYGIVLLITVLWAARRFTLPDFSIRYSRELLIFALLFTLVIFASAMPGGISQREMLALIRYLILFAYVMILYDLLDPGDTIGIFVAMTLPLIVGSYLIISVYLHSSSIIGTLGLLRYKVTGFMVNANTFGFLLITVLPFWISLALWWDKLYIRIGAGIMAVIFSVATLLSNSRASIVGFVAALFTFSVWTKKLKYFILAVGLMLIVVYSIPQLRELATLAFRLDRGTSGRTDIWKQTILMIEDHPLLGVGMGNFRTEYFNYYRNGWERGFFGYLSHAHNFILTMIAEIGILGIFFIVAIYYIPMRACVRSMKASRNLKEKAIVRAITAIFIAYYANSIFEGGGILLEARMYADIIFWILLVLILNMEFTFQSDRSVSLKSH